MHVNVATFRNTTDHLFKLTRDLCSCVGRNERESLGEIMKRILKEAEEQQVKRAKPYDKEQRIKATQRIEACIIQAFSEEGHKANEAYSKKLAVHVNGYQNPHNSGEFSLGGLTNLILN